MLVVESPVKSGFSALGALTGPKPVRGFPNFP